MVATRAASRAPATSKFYQEVKQSVLDFVESVEAIGSEPELFSLCPHRLQFPFDRIAFDPFREYP